MTIPAFLGIGVKMGSDNKLRIDGVWGNSPADHAGLQLNDIIVAMDGQKIATEADYDAIRTTKAPGDQLVVEVSRADRSVTLTVRYPIEPSTEAENRYRLLPPYER